MTVRGDRHWLSETMAALADPRSTSGIVPNLQKLAEQSSKSPLAATTYAYFALHRDLRPQTVAFCEARLLELLEQKKELGAAPLLLIECRLFSSDEADWGRIDVDLLHISLREEPSWTLNWLFLGWHQSAMRTWDLAAASFKTALANTLRPPLNLSPVQEAYEDLFTGRTGDRDAIAVQLRHATEMMEN